MTERPENETDEPRSVLGALDELLKRTSLAFVSWLHLLLWLLALLFAMRFLGEALRQAGSQSGAVLWVGLFCVVSFQVTTLVRPVLWRAPGAPLFEGSKMFFLEQFGRIMDGPTAPPAKKP